MKSIFIIFSIAFLSLMSCEKTGEEYQNADRESLDKLRQRIEQMADVPCEEASQWLITALGHKACGGAMSYIAYPSTIDVDEFLALVKEYTQGEQDYNKKYGIISDCALVLPPESVRCEDGKPVFVYKNTAGFGNK